MTRSRLAATAALSITAVLVPTTGGEAGTGTIYRADGQCTEEHTMTRDFFHTKVKVEKNVPRGSAQAAAFRPAAGVKVIVKLIDLTPQNGDNVVGKARKSDKTNDKGIAKTTHEFNNFGNYRLKIKAKTGGEVVAKDRIDVGVDDRVDGPCGPPVSGGGPPA
jgi:hypothetical protein